MQKIPPMVDMARSPEEISDGGNVPDVMSAPLYPYGLAISLTQNELNRLDLDEDVSVGDMIHMHCIAKVTAISHRDMADGPQCRIELQITHIAAEDEDEENEEAEDEEESEPLESKLKKFYPNA